jgi:hypothetical protein
MISSSGLASSLTLVVAWASCPARPDGLGRPSTSARAQIQGAHCSARSAATGRCRRCRRGDRPWSSPCVRRPCFSVRRRRRSPGRVTIDVLADGLDELDGRFRSGGERARRGNLVLVDVVLVRGVVLAMQDERRAAADDRRQRPVALAQRARCGRMVLAQRADVDVLEGPCVVVKARPLPCAPG